MVKNKTKLVIFILIISSGLSIRATLKATGCLSQEEVSNAISGIITLDKKRRDQNPDQNLYEVENPSMVTFGKKSPMEMEMKDLRDLYKDEPPVIIAAKTGNLEMLINAIESGADVDAVSKKSGLTPFEIALNNENELIAAALIVVGADILNLKRLAGQN